MSIYRLIESNTSNVKQLSKEQQTLFNKLLNDLYGEHLPRWRQIISSHISKFELLDYSIENRPKFIFSPYSARMEFCFINYTIASGCELIEMRDSVRKCINHLKKYNEENGIEFVNFSCSNLTGNRACIRITVLLRGIKKSDIDRYRSPIFKSINVI